MIRYKVVISQPTIVHAARQRGHLRQSVKSANGMATGELSDIAIKMLGAHLVIGALVATLEHGPEAFDAVCVRLTIHILPDAVFDGLVAECRRKAQIPFVLIRENRCSGFYIVRNKSSQRCCVSFLNYCRLYFSAALFCTDNSCFADRAATSVQSLAAVLLLSRPPM